MTLPDAVLRYAWSGTGQVESVAADGDTLAYGYDGALPTSVQSSGSVNGYVEQGYDGDLRLAYQSVNFGSEVWYGYDDDGLVTEVGDLVVIRDAPSGRMTETVLGEVRTGYDYSDLGEFRAMWTVLGGDTLFRTTYRRDAGGRIDQVTETSSGSTTTWAYGYDAAGRLETVLRDGQPFASYEYDANGNRERVVASGGVVQAAFDAQDRMMSLGGAAYGYTEVGQLAFRAVGADTTHYDYDARGILRAVRMPDGTRIEYLADAAGRRTGQVVNGVRGARYLYGRSASPLAEVDSAGNVVTRFVYGVAGHVPDYMVRGDRTYRLVVDHLGSVRRVVDTGSGEVAQEIDYDAYGRVLRDSNPGFQPFGYAGGLLDQHTGLTRFGARDYDAQTGRWTAKDPIGFRGRSSNLYTYALSDPVNLHDPEGTIPIVAVPGIMGGLIGGVAGGVGAVIAGESLGGVARATTVGAATGAVSAYTGLLGGAAVAALGNMAVQYLDPGFNGSLCVSSVVLSAAAGGMGSGVARGLRAMNSVVDEIDEIGFAMTGGVIAGIMDVIPRLGGAFGCDEPCPSR